MKCLFCSPRSGSNNLSTIITSFLIQTEGCLGDLNEYFHRHHEGIKYVEDRDGIQFTIPNDKPFLHVRWMDERKKRLNLLLKYPNHFFKIFISDLDFFPLFDYIKTREIISLDRKSKREQFFSQAMLLTTGMPKFFCTSNMDIAYEKIATAPVEIPEIMFLKMTQQTQYHNEIQKMLDIKYHIVFEDWRAGGYNYLIEKGLWREGLIKPTLATDEKDWRKNSQNPKLSLINQYQYAPDKYISNYDQILGWFEQYKDIYNE